MLVEILASLAVLFFLYLKLKKPANYPPGPWGVPLIGYRPSDKKEFYQQVIDLYKEHGNCPVISWRLGTKLVVFLFDSKQIKEAFANKALIDRPVVRIFSYNTHSKGKGILLNNGHQWTSTSRFTRRHLKTLGMGKTSLVPFVQKEAVELMNIFKKQAGVPAPLPLGPVFVSSFNIIWQLVAGKRFSSEDENVKTHLQRLHRFREVGYNLTLLDLMPWVSKLLPQFLVNKIFHENHAIEFWEKIMEFVEKDVDEHMKRDIDETNVRDYIDAYLLEMKEQGDSPDSLFSLADLKVTVGDLFGTGTESGIMSVVWMCHYLAAYPNVQKRLQEEVDKAIPKGTLPTLEDRIKLQYVECFINEVLRHSNFVKLGVMHAASEDVNIGGYKIPKGAVVTPFMHWSNFDPKYWDSPEEFRPERFLDDNGKCSLPKDTHFPFGTGKRTCIAESLAKMDLLLFVSIFAQNISFSVPTGISMNMNGTPNIFLSHPDFDQELLISIR